MYGWFSQTCESLQIFLAWPALPCISSLVNGSLVYSSWKPYHSFILHIEILCDIYGFLKKKIPQIWYFCLFPSYRFGLSQHLDSGQQHPRWWLRCTSRDSVPKLGPNIFAKKQPESRLLRIECALKGVHGLPFTSLSNLIAFSSFHPQSFSLLVFQFLGPAQLFPTSRFCINGSLFLEHSLSTTWHVFSLIALDIWYSDRHIVGTYKKWI